MKKKIIVYGGGTISHIRPHFALCAPAYGSTARRLVSIIRNTPDFPMAPSLRLTKMAGGGHIESSHDLMLDIQDAINDSTTGAIIMSAAVCDFDAESLKEQYGDTCFAVRKDAPRLQSSKDYTLDITAAEKILPHIRKDRKDIFLVGFKTTWDLTTRQMFDSGVGLLKGSSANLVLVNDIKARQNMIVTPEMASYGVTGDRYVVMKTLVDMIASRSQGTFYKTTVTESIQIQPWDAIPSRMAALKRVVDWLVDNGAYQAFNDVTVGHFGHLERAGNQYHPIDGPAAMWSSRRKHNYNREQDRSMVLVEIDAHNPHMTAYGFKPSAGARSQYEVLSDFGSGWNVVHFHCPLKEGKTFPTRPQFAFECGSFECGENTRDGLVLMDWPTTGRGIYAVMLDKHGPNIVFHKDENPLNVINFIDAHFDLSKRAGSPETIDEQVATIDKEARRRGEAIAKAAESMRMDGKIR